MPDSPKVGWLLDAPPSVQTEYFELRNRRYLQAWGHLQIAPDYGLRDEFDDGAVVVALESDGRIAGGVRANIVRPRDPLARKTLPVEASWSHPIRLQEIFPEHGLDRVNYAEASKLFLQENIPWDRGTAVTLAMLDFLMNKFRDVSITYLGLPFSLLNMYRLLAKFRRVDYTFREVAGANPHASQAPDDSTRWGVFACLHAPAPGRT